LTNGDRRRTYTGGEVAGANPGNVTDGDWKGKRFNCGNCHGGLKRSSQAPKKKVSVGQSTNPKRGTGGRT